jgi:uncharacterized radical SAM superfamily protein
MRREEKEYARHVLSDAYRDKRDKINSSFSVDDTTEQKALVKAIEVYLAAHLRRRVPSIIKDIVKTFTALSPRTILDRRTADFGLVTSYSISIEGKGIKDELKQLKEMYNKATDALNIRLNALLERHGAVEEELMMGNCKEALELIKASRNEEF